MKNTQTLSILRFRIRYIIMYLLFQGHREQNGFEHKRSCQPIWLLHAFCLTKTFQNRWFSYCFSAQLQNLLYFNVFVVPSPSGTTIYWQDSSWPFITKNVAIFRLFLLQFIKSYKLTTQTKNQATVSIVKDWKRQVYRMFSHFWLTECLNVESSFQFGIFHFYFFVISESPWKK